MRGRHLIPSFVLYALLIPPALAEQPAVTIYNQDFGVVREKIALDLQAGVNQIRFTDITAHVEAESVFLRDPTGKHRLQILEQNYCADPLSAGLLLSQFEGKTLEFRVYDPTAPYHEKPISAKLVRSAYVPHPRGWNQYGEEFAQAQGISMSGGGGEPIVEVEGKLCFGLPGKAMFPSLGNDAILKPTLSWLLETDTPGKLDAELSYITGGMSWKADYNLIAPGDAGLLELVGWVTIDNQSGRTFEDAQIKLMAGDVSKLQRTGERRLFREISTGRMRPEQTEPSDATPGFDEYHLYDLPRPTTLHDRETKQVEFIRAAGIQATRIYVYDGVKIDRHYYENWDATQRRERSDFGVQCNPKIWGMCEFKNSADNHLGVPLPAGRLRFYRGDSDSRLEFVGENEIDHAPKDELVRVYTGNAFDLVGERRRTEFKIDHNQDWLDESFEIKLRNHKPEPVEVRVVEHLYRWNNWEIREPSDAYTKVDAQTIEFRVTVPPDGEKVVTYSVHYSW
jgi:hypothetical protein